MIKSIAFHMRVRIAHGCGESKLVDKNRNPFQFAVF